MSQAYSDPIREDDPHALPDIEVFYRTDTANRADGWIDDEGDPLPGGWYWWTCFPGCLPDSDPDGPYDSEADALSAAQATE